MPFLRYSSRIRSVQPHAYKLVKFVLSVDSNPAVLHFCDIRIDLECCTSICFVLSFSMLTLLEFGPGLVFFSKCAAIESSWHTSKFSDATPLRKLQLFGNPSFSIECMVCSFLSFPWQLELICLEKRMYYRY